jgi:hypothetical protein
MTGQIVRPNIRFGFDNFSGKIPASQTAYENFS